MSTEEPTRTSSSMGQFPPPWLFAWGKWTREVVFLAAVSIIAAFILNFVHPHKVPLVNDWTLAAAESKLSRGKPIRVDEAVALVERQGAVFIDVRSSEAFATAHIPGAISLPMSHKDITQLVEACRLLPPETGVVIYCCGENTERGSQLVQALADEQGIKASLLKGGFEDWAASKAPLEQG